MPAALHPRLALLLALFAAPPALAAPDDAAPSPPASITEVQDVSRDAARIYAQAKASLFQIRVLNASSRSQVTAGSGFVIGRDGLGMTNYHVVAQLALQPARYVGEAVGTGGEADAIEVLKIDVLNDLALIRLKTQRGWPPLALRTRPLAQGERLFSLGNPLDLGFAISEGAFNGEVVRPYYPQLLFSGALNPGMSGGPAVDGHGAVVGVNVAKRLDGELISFLVPARHAAALLDEASAAAQPSAAAFRDRIARQLDQHQQLMTQRLLAAPLATRPLGPYLAPVSEMPGMRCWGSASEQPRLKYDVSRLACNGEYSPFIEDALRTGYINVRHEYLSSKTLDALRFLRVYSQSYRNEHFGSFRDRHWSGPECTDAFVAGGDGAGPPLRAVVCVRALRRFAGLYSFALMAATVDDSRRGLQTRVDVSGVSLENGKRIVQSFLAAIQRQP